MDVKKACFRILEQQLIRLIEDWDAIDSLFDQELSDPDWHAAFGTQIVIEKEMAALVNSAENKGFITWDDWRLIHRVIMQIGMTAEDRTW